MTNPPLILASSSPYRRELLGKLNLPFTCASPAIDETVRIDERAKALVMRLSRAKAAAVASRADTPNGALIIGCDQVAELDAAIIGKPRDHLDAVQQLRRMSGRAVMLYSGIVLLDTRGDDGGDGGSNSNSDSYSDNDNAPAIQTAVECFHVEFRRLTDATIERYLAAEQPYQCCGSLKAEGVGIALLARLRGDDPNAVIGLPLIRLVEMLGNVGVEVV